MKTIILTLLTFIVAINVTTAQNYPKMVRVAGGTFTMGSSSGRMDEQPTHDVTLSSYYIGKTEVTVAQYRYYCRATGTSMPEEPDWGWNDNDPIVMVSWNDAIKYCNWLADRLDENITLPTEAQWEFATRGGNKSKGYKYSGSNNIDEVAWWYTDDEAAHRVATKKANELGLYDMSGNVHEWCLDWYSSSGKYRMLRGGSWYNLLAVCRVAFRSYNLPGSRFIHLGFRVVSL